MRYDLRNKETGEVSEWTMSYRELDPFLLVHPELEVVFLQMTVGDPVALGVKQPPSDFTNHILRPIEKRYFGKSKESRFRGPSGEY